VDTQTPSSGKWYSTVSGNRFLVVCTQRVQQGTLATALSDLAYAVVIIGLQVAIGSANEVSQFDTLFYVYY
jgi:hypothetical protein